MKLIQVILLVTVLGLVAADNFRHFADSIFYPTFKAIFEGRCKQHVDSKTTEELLNFVKYFDECITDINAPVPSIVPKDFLNYQCTDKYPNENKCTKTLSEKIAPCLGADEKFLSDFLFKTFTASSDYLCQQESLDYWKGSLNINKAVYCLVRQADVVKNCLKEPTLVKDLSKPDSVITPTVLCRGLKDIQECILEGLKKPCEETQVLEFFSRRYKSLTTLCTS